MRISTIERHLREALGDDSRVALAAVRQLIEEDVPWLERRAVRQARWHGYSWARIGRLLMRTRQSVRERFAVLDGQPLIFPTEDLERRDEYETLVIRARRRAADRRRMVEFDELDAADAVPW